MLHYSLKITQKPSTAPGCRLYLCLTEFSKAKRSMPTELTVKTSGETFENKFDPRLIQSRLWHQSLVSCTTESVPAAFFFSRAQVTVDKNTCTIKSEICHSESVVKQANSHVVILTRSQAATWSFFYYTACKPQHKITTYIRYQGVTEVLNEGRILLR